MSASTQTAGYPVHRVVSYRRWSNPAGVAFTDWTAACDATGSLTGAMSTFGTAGQARRAELCRACFPNGHQAPRGEHWPDPLATGRIRLAEPKDGS